jgi:hypothetical protein
MDNVFVKNNLCQDIALYIGAITISFKQLSTST